MMKTKAEVLIDQITQAAEEQERLSDQAPFEIDDVVTLSEGEHEYIGIIEEIDKGVHQIRVQAVAGDEFEPTDKVFFRYEEEIAHYEKAPVVEDDNEDGDDDDSPEGQEKSFADGDKVSWTSKDGNTKGIVKECGENDLFKLEVFAPVDEKFEATGVEVTVHESYLSKSEFEVKEAKNVILVKMRDVDVEYDDKKGKFKGIGSAYGQVDLGGDIIAPGAYTQTIKHKNGKVKLFTDHGWEVPQYMGIAHLEDTKDGLMVEAEMPLEATDVKNTYIKVKFSVESGDPLGLSIGYNPIKVTNNADGTRTLNEIALEEMSITPFPMDTHARILSAKARRIGYQSKSHLWQSIQSDAPSGNQGE